MENEEINKKLDLIIEEGGYGTPEWIYSVLLIIGVICYGTFQKLFS